MDFGQESLESLVRKHCGTDEIILPCTRILKKLFLFFNGD